MDDLISRSAAIEALLKQPNTLTPSVIRRVLRQVPGVDAVIRPVVEQIQWERDCAIEQLKEHNIPFGGIAPDVVKVVRCKDCNVPHNKWLGCPNLNGLIPPPDFFCAKGERREEND